MHKEVLELTEVGELILARVRDSISDCFVIVDDPNVVRFMECSEESDDVFVVSLQFFGSMRENKGKCF